MANEIQRLYYGSQSSPVASGNLEAGDYTLTFDGQTTSAITFDASDATIEAALEALSNVGVGDIDIAATANGYNATFQGALANTNVPQMTAGSITLMQKADTVSVTTTQNGAAEVAEEWLLDISGNSSGTYKITVAGSGSTGNINHDAAATAVETELDSYGAYTVTDLGGGIYKISVLANVSLLITDDNTDSGVEITEDVPYSAGQPQIVTVTLPDSPTEGTLNVTLDATTSSDFNYSDSSPASITGWTGGGSAGNWTYTRDTNASNVSVSGAEGSTPLRKACAIEIVTTQEGSSGGGATAHNLLLLGVGA